MTSYEWHPHGDYGEDWETYLGRMTAAVATLASDSDTMSPAVDERAQNPDQPQAEAQAITDKALWQLHSAAVYASSDNLPILRSRLDEVRRLLPPVRQCLSDCSLTAGHDGPHVRLPKGEAS
jgi:hypothetical protein